MATKTSLLGLTKPAYTEAADIAVLNTNFDLIDKAVGNGARSANLLRNSNFANPINTSGENLTTKNWQYFIDGWILAATDASPVYFDISKEYRSVGFSTSTGADIYLIQRFPLGVLKQNTTYTYAYRRWGVTYVGLVSGFEETDTFTQFVMQVSSGSYLEWVALYEGTYTADTLPTYVAPDKRIEMIRCGVPMNPPNLLDNSWFVNPINQRGLTSFAGVGYFIDRWASWAEDNHLNLNANGITVTKSLIQGIACDNTKTYTAAVCLADGSIYVGTGIPENEDFGVWNKVWVTKTEYGVIFYLHAESEQTYRWAALYEGAYTAETLPEYHYKGYASELAECQRYYIKIATQPVSGWCYNWGRVTVFVPLPVMMRVASPTVSVTSASRNFYIGSTAYAAEPTGSTAVSNGISVYFSHSHTGNGQCIMPEFSAEVSADL